MTAQSHEKLIYKGKEMSMASEPLGYYLKQNKVPISLYSINTACWRGYYGKWKIEDDKLYLTHLEGSGVYLDKATYAEQKRLLKQQLKAGVFPQKEHGKLLREAEKKCTHEFELTVDFLFPGQKEVFASWFTGTIRIPQGKQLNYIHAGYMSVYEEDLFLEFEAGILKSTNIVDNRKNPFPPSFGMG
jgi:hypothetical protein